MKRGKQDTERTCEPSRTSRPRDLQLDCSLVEIDSRQKKNKTTGGWQNEFDRPIYFVELRDSYVCSWCELDGGHLMLVPCPRSREQVRQVRYPGDADIVGRVTALTMRIGASQDELTK